MPTEIEKLEVFIRKNPSLADVPFILIKEKPMSPREALENLRVKRRCDEVRVAIASELTLNVLWLLTEEYYRRLIKTPEPHPKIIWIDGEMTFKEALEQVEQRTVRGKEIAESYRSLLNEIRRRLHG